MDDRISEILRRPENEFCADCGDAEPQWCNISIGVVICRECASIHLKLCNYWVIIQTTPLENWTEAWVEQLGSNGNKKASDVYEERLPSTWPRSCLKSSSGVECFIRAKYEHKLLASRATKVLDEFYDLLRRQHCDERERMRKHNVKASKEKSNRQEAYIDEMQRASALAASRQFLTSHQEWFSGPKALSNDELIARVAFQHFIASDVEDLNLEPARRKTCDEFSSSHSDICEQFLKDATRSTYVIRGEELDFQHEVELFEKANIGSAITAFQDKFVERVVAALRQGLGGNPPPVLLRAASIILSQSGMAHLERACRSPPVVVSGGQQSVRYEMEQRKPGVWEMHLLTEKTGFSEAVVYPGIRSATEDTVHVPACRPGSRVLKSVVIALTLDESDRISVDVRSLEDDVKLLDGNGEPHNLEESQSFADRFLVLLCRSSRTEPLGLAPCRHARNRGVLKLKADIAPGSPADSWNQMQEDSYTKLNRGDFVISVNGKHISRDVDAWKELKEMQVVLEIVRVRPFGASHSYEQVLVDVYSLFNPSKLYDLAELLAKGASENLLLKVCRKYVKEEDDWQDLMRSFLKHRCKNLETEKAVGRAEALLKQKRPDERPEFFVAFCRHLIDKASPSMTEFAAGLEQSDFRAQAEDHLLWPQLRVALHLQDASAPLGIRHDRESLSQQQIFKIKEVLLQTPASSSGLQVGDVVESIGGVDAIAVVQGGRQKAFASLKETGGVLEVVLRRKQPMASEVEMSVLDANCGDSESDTSELDFRAKFTKSLIEDEQEGSSAQANQCDGEEKAEQGGTTITLFSGCDDVQELHESATNSGK